LTDWIPLVEASDFFNSPREFVEFVKEHAVKLRGKFCIDRTLDLEDTDRTAIPRRFVLNSIFRIEANQILANDSFSVPEGLTNYEMYWSVQVSKRALDQALISLKKPKRGPRFKYDRALLDRIFEEEYDPALYSQRQFAEYVRSLYRKAGARAPDERTIRRALETKMKARLTSTGA
jgi:hypothetical protein